MDDQNPPNNALEIRARYDSLYEHVVKPDRALYLPGYFKRWIKALGPDLAWMYASFRQAAYMDGGRDGLITSRFAVAEVAARAGITERTFWNRASNAATWERLTGLVTRIEEEPKWDISSGIPKQLPRQFVVAMTLPLTAADTTSLKRWLNEHLEQYGGAEGVLRAAAAAPVSQLIPADAEHHQQEKALTVRQLVCNMFNSLDAKLLDALAAAIQNNLMPANDQIKITVFFMEHVLPYLGAGPAWIVTLMRDRCFDSEVEQRNQVILKQGYNEIAAWFGLSRAKTVWEWLNLKKGGRYANPIFRLYVREQVHARDYDTRERTFQVLFEEIPNEMLEAFATGTGLAAQLLVPHANIHHILSSRGFGANFSLGLAQFSAAEDFGAFFSLGLADFSAHLGANFSLGLAQFSLPFGANFRVKNSLTPPENPITPPTQPAHAGDEEHTPAEGQRATEPAGTVSGPAPVVGRAGWDFSQIARNNAVNAKSAKELRRSFADEQALSQKFLAWILYAYSPLGKGLTDTSGVSKAIKSLCNTQPEFAPQKFERLVKLGSAKLRELFDRDYAREELGKSAEANIYRANFKKLDPARKADLYFALFGADCPEPTVAPKAAPQKTVFQIRMEQVRARKAQQATAP